MNNVDREYNKLLKNLYDNKKADSIITRRDKENLLIKEAIDFLEKRWKEIFPEDDLTKDEKPYAYVWFNNRPKGC